MSSSPETTSPPEQIHLETNDALPTLWVDNLRFSVRGDVPVCMLSFYQAVFGQSSRPEVIRLAMSVRHAQSVIDIMARLLDYYPARPEGPETKG